ncbi:MAG: ribonuclease [Alphaproteobacteria bacterium CG11_big_fil_rev_8_21_14_0_20_39_49]|nr:MAG: ribonuclease [Alphaproteobacteria bacterium CG11_big_fil_rev_8_21_14_0_20_39_49]
MLSVKQVFKCFYNAAYDTVRHDGIEHAGYLAFLALLALFPFLVFFVAIAGYIGQSDVGIKMIDLILQNDLIPEEIIPALKPRIQEIASGPPQGLLTIAIFGSIWTASSMVDGLRTILNRAYRVSTPPAYIWRRLMSIGEFIILTAALMIVTLLLIIAPNLWSNLQESLELKEITELLHLKGFSASPAWGYIRYIITTITLFLVVIAAYIILPNTKQGVLSVSYGAAIVIIFWFIAGALFSKYLSNFDQVNIIYGSLGGIIAFLLFFYITAMIFIFGAEFNYRLQKARGHKIEEKEQA